MTCQVEDCGSHVHARGLCNRHYKRLLKFGRTSLPQLSFEERFWAKVRKTDTCWLWTGALCSAGYGRVRMPSGTAAAHRVAYELLVGPIPRGLALDHVHARGCRHRSCVNPAHLEPVTPTENTRRAYALITHCPQGHPYDEANTYRRKDRPGRECRTCRSWAYRHRGVTHVSA